MPAVKRTSTESRPTLRKASTLTLDDDSDTTTKDPLRKIASKKSFKSKKSTSLAKKASLVAEDGGMCTALVSLESGSHIGKTASFKAAAKETKNMDVTTMDEDAGDKTETPVAAAVSTLVKSVSIEKSPSVSKAPSLTKKASSRRSNSYVAPPLPPGGLIEIAISFDTTGSMYSYLDEVRSRIQDMVQKLQADIPGIRIAIIAHGDYCDKDNYIVKWIDFGANVAEICDFVKTVKPTGGGDGDECYELVLRRTQEVLSWTPGSQRSLIMIGDAPPHEPGYRYVDFVNDIDWREEAQKLKEMNVRIYSVGANNAAKYIKFYKEISKVTGGQVLELKNFGILFDMLMTICYHEGGSDLVDAYESEVRARHGGSSLNAALEALFSKIRDPDADTTDSSPTSLFSSAKPVSFKTAPRKILKAVRKYTGASKKPAKTVASKVKKPSKIKDAKKTVKKVTSKSKKMKTKKAPKKQQKMKPKKRAPARVKRESLNDAKFMQGPLSKVNWTAWKIGLSKDKPPKAKRADWKKNSVLSGHFNSKLIAQGDLKKKSIWEFGVRCPGKKKVYPVLYNILDGTKTSMSWCRYLLAWPLHIRKIASHVISKGGDIMVRIGIPNKKITTTLPTIRKYMLKNFDYCWRMDHKRKGHRKLKRVGFIVSM